MSWPEILLQLCAFTAVFAAMSLLVQWFNRSEEQIAQRVAALSRRGASQRVTRKPQAAARGGWLVALLRATGLKSLPRGQSDRDRLQARLHHAGFYSASAPSVFMGVKLVLMLVSAFVAAILLLAGVVDSRTGGLLAVGLACVGMLVPAWWLDWRKARRQTTLRRALPDFLDLIVCCIESGLSFEAALRRVSEELHEAHPLLADEMKLVQYEMQLGSTPDAALAHFAKRSGLDVARSLGKLVQQARTFGTSMGEALRMQAEILRSQRELRAEELAQQAAVKILLPTMLFIFPAIFVVLVGPAAIDLSEKFAAQGPATAEAKP